MGFYKLTAEHVRDKKELLLELAKASIEVMMAGTDPTFSSMFDIILVGDRKDADLARDMVWQYNCGAYCCVCKLTEDEYDELC